jgi:hypothetical protein
VKELYTALLAVRAQAPRVVKDKTAKVRSDKASYSYAYADLETVTEAVEPLLIEQGLLWLTTPSMTSDGFHLGWTLVHAETGQELTGVYPLPDPIRTSPQGVGSAITYARRYCLVAVLGLTPSGDDDDARAAQERWNRQAEQDADDARKERGLRQRARQPQPPPGEVATGQGEHGAASRPPARGHVATKQESRQAHAVQQPPVTPDQVRLLQTLAGKLGLGADRERRLTVTGNLIGRPVDSFNSLTRAEASQVVDAFEARIRELAASAGPTS